MDDGWRFPRLSRVVHNINTARKLDKFTDVTFIVGRGEDACIIEAHRVVVGTASAELAKLVSGSERPLKIRIEDVSPKGFKNLIRYLYDIDVKFSDFSTVRETFLVAEKYKVNRLRLAAENYLNHHVKYAGPVLEMLKLAIDYELQNLKRRCIDNISTNYQDLLKSEEFASSPYEVVHTVLSVRHYCGDESQSQALLAISNWKKKNGTDRKLLECLLNCVDLTCARTDFDANDQETERLLSTEDITALEKYKLTKNVSDAPIWYQSSRYVLEKKAEAEKNDAPTRKRTFSEKMKLEKAKFVKACDQEIEHIGKRMKKAADETMQKHEDLINRTVAEVMSCFTETFTEGVETALECYADDMSSFTGNEGQKN